MVVEVRMDAMSAIALGGRLRSLVAFSGHHATALGDLPISFAARHSALGYWFL